MLNPFTSLVRVQVWHSMNHGLLRRAISAIALAAVILCTTLGLPSAAQALPPGNAITDGRALLRYALPIDNEPVRTLQSSIEDISEALRGRRRLSSVNTNLIRAERILDRADEKLLPSVRSDQQAEAQALIANIKDDIGRLREAIDAKDKSAIWDGRTAILDKVGVLEESMVQDFPFEVPAEYSHLAQLKGRATLEVTTTQGSLTMVADGYNAPVTAGNFVDLVQRGFYDGLPFTRAEDFYVVQVGDPPGPDEGFMDPTTGAYRAIPLEVMVEGDSEPVYGVTLEDAGRFLDQPVLPFSSYGTVAMARPGDEPNGASSQFFFFLFEPELTPAGLNLLDGRYAVFGYVVENKEVLGKLKPGDSIESIRVVDGLDNFIPPQA
ncbi:MAG: peptidylprolyl isomerase [Leptolyngbya sp. DLM2.Bin15]|nr:MAG: peptidylprolyl isomerase [Leptolyngbya sp. DLM2.Bin15]